MQIKSVYNSHMNFRQYVNSLRSFLTAGDCNRFVLGNSGADYDSVIGSLVYAFYMTTSLKMLYLPLIDCPQADLPLRFEVTTVLDSLTIRYDQLLYTSMIPKLYQSNYSFVLYDHNTRPQIPPHHVTQIVDHHAYDPASVKCPHVISHCGSALTLLYYLYYPALLHKFQNTQLFNKYANYFKEHKHISKQDSCDEHDEINQLIYYGILIDTYGLSPNQAQVWTQFDKYAIQTLEKKIEPKFTFDQLGQVKFDVSKNLKLSFDQQQRKDYKQIRYGNYVFHYSTILLNIDLFIKRYSKEIHEQLAIQKMKDNQVYAFMFSFPSEDKTDVAAGKFQKYILFNSKNKQIVAKVQKIMEQLNFTKLEDAEGWRKWVDLTGKISRKIFDKQLKAKLS